MEATFPSETLVDLKLTTPRVSQNLELFNLRRDSRCPDGDSNGRPRNASRMRASPLDRSVRFDCVYGGTDLASYQQLALVICLSLVFDLNGECV
jgi:hypothetical protein